MNTEKTSNVKIVTKPSLMSTLKALNIGKPTLIKSKQFKPNSVRNAVSRLNKTNLYHFSSTEEGLIDAIKVTRLK